MIRVAVCTNRSPAAVAETLAAIDAQASGAPRALVTSGLAPAAVAEHAGAAPGWELLAEPRPGLSRARNRALAWAEEDHDVLAFVDDDALVDPSWWAALADAWAHTTAEVACVGGPIRLRFATPPPAWLSEPLLPALTRLDRGPEVRDLDPARETVYGANISFRAGPLRTVGGFDPALGHSGGRVLFGEEDAAQRALGRLGYRVRYVPGAGVEHLVPPSRLTRGSFVRRRFAYGAGLGAAGGRRREVAVRELVLALAGIAVAAAARDDVKLMERAVRGAENAGALAGPLVLGRRSRRARRAAPRPRPTRSASP